jgi:hypothetical protein
MRALAEWVMRGRLQAIVATVLSASIPLLFLWVEAGSARLLLGLVATVLMTLSAAIVGLVVLRRTVSDGLGLMFWALLPALVWLVWRDEASPLVALIGTTALAVVLKRTVSWSQTLSVATVVALMISFLIDTLLPGTVIQVTAAAGQLIEILEQTHPEVAQELDVNWLRELLLGVIVASYLGTVLSSLALSRWWQSMLYNPGGFRAEFHGLRLPPLFAAAGLIVLVLANSLPGEMVRWLPVMITPFMMAGMALVHGTVAKRSLSRSWLIAFYTGMFIAGPYLIALLIMLAVADSFIDIRHRLKART